MELIAGLFFLAVVILVPAGAVAGFVARARSRRNEERLSDLSSEVWELQSRLDVISRRLKELAPGDLREAAEAEHEPTPEVTAPAIEPEPEVVAAPEAPPPAPVHAPPSPVIGPVTARTMEEAAPGPTAAEPEPPAPPPDIEPVAAHTMEEAAPVPAAAEPEPPAPPPSPLPEPPPRRAVVPSSAPFQRQAETIIPPARKPASLEMEIGSSWLNRIGITLVVIGITFALGYTLTHLGPAGKSALATATALALLVVGVRLEPKQGYATYGRGLIAGGWAGLYVTVYAMHELQATRIIESPFAGFALLLLVGLGMILHSLRYDNEGLTLLTYALAYGAIVIHSIEPYTLAAAALLGAGTVAHLLRRRWYGTALGGLIATYGSLLIWYARQTEMTLSTLELGLGALALDWAVFMTAEFATRPVEPVDHLRARWLSALNVLGVTFLSFSAWMQFSPDGAWLVFGVLGLVYAVTSTALRRLGRTASHQVHSIAAAALLALAAARALDPIPASWAVLVESLAILFLGIRLRDRFHRILGSAFLALPLVAIAIEQLHARAALPDGGLQASRLAVILAGIGAAYLASWSLKRAASSEGLAPPENNFARAFSYAAFTLVLLAFFVQLPVVYLAPASALLMLVLFPLSRLFRSEDLDVQAYLSAAMAALSALGLTAPSLATLGSFHVRVPAILVVAGALWLLKRVAAAERTDANRVGVARTASYTAFALVLLGFYLQLPNVYMAPATAALMLALFAVSKALRSEDLEIQAYLSAAVATAFALGMTAPSHATLGPGPARVPALLFVAAALIAAFATRKREAAGVNPHWPEIRPAFAWAGIGLAALAVWLEARPVAVGPAWMVMAIVAVEWGLIAREPDLRYPGYLLVLASHISLVASNLTATDITGGISLRAATILPSIAATYYLWWRLRGLGGTGSERAGGKHDEIAGRVLTYLGAAAAGLFSRFEFGLDGASIRWSAIMVFLFILGYRLSDADFRLQAYLLAFAIGARAVGFDFAQAAPFLGIDGPLAVALASSLGLVAAGFVVRRARARPASPERRTISLEARLAPYGQDLLWLIAAGLVAIYIFRAAEGFPRIVEWALEGSVVTAAGFAFGSKALRLAGLGILAAALVTTLVWTFTVLDTPGRIISFIVLGVLLLLVSLAYTRYQARSKEAS